jgi:hypothetical protein
VTATAAPAPPARRGMLGFYVAMGVLLAVVVPLAGNCGRIMLRRDASRLRELRASPAWPDVATDGLICGLFGRLVREGMTYEEITAVLGKPQPERCQFEADRLDPASGRRRCTWFATDEGGGGTEYTVTFDPTGRADFVPRILNWRHDSEGRRTTPNWAWRPEQVGRGPFGEPRQ